MKNRIGHENFWRNLAHLQLTEEPDDFKIKHKDKMKIVFWVAVSSVGIYTLEAIAREIAMKLGGIR